MTRDTTLSEEEWRRMRAHADPDLAGSDDDAEFTYYADTEDYE